MAKKHWIQKAIKHPGALTNQAKKAGMGLTAYMMKEGKKGSHASSTTKKRIALAKTLRGLHK